MTGSSQGFPEQVDVVVVGGGNAALCAALAARESGATVLVLERAPREKRGGNSAFTGGAFRVAYDGVGDLMKIMPEMSSQERDSADFGTYTESKYLDDLGDLSGYRIDPDSRRRSSSAAWRRCYGCVRAAACALFRASGASRFA